MFGTLVLGQFLSNFEIWKDQDIQIYLIVFLSFFEHKNSIVLHHYIPGWHIDVARFFLERGSDVNKADKYGRCPLHIAAAVDYEEMVDFLINNGADVLKTTHHEGQTAMHYAAKNNAIQSMKVGIHYF